MKTLYLTVDYNKTLDKYYMIKHKRMNKQDYIPAKTLRRYNLSYINNMKRGWFYESDPLFLLTNLEALGKPRLAERAYVYMLSKGWIRGL